MDLLQNPFYILAATPWDNRRRIMELADARSLFLDSSKCMEARSDLTNPRKRLSAEVAWLPGIGPKQAGVVLSLLESSPMDLRAVDTLSPAARANLLAAGLARLPSYNADDAAEWILEITWAFEDIDPEELSAIINEERVVSGFPEVSDLSAVEFEIQERRGHYRQVIKSALNNLSSPQKLVETVTVVVDTATDEGEQQTPILIADLVDLYEVEAQGFLDREESNIRALVEKLRADVDAERPDSVLDSAVNHLIQGVKNWDAVAQPIQIGRKGQGLEHDPSYRVAAMVRNLAIHMFNEHGKLDCSRQITSMLQEVFAEVGEVAERSAEDANALENIAEQQVRSAEDAKKRAAKWRREITYETEIGIIFKDKLRISPEGIEWRGRRWDLDSITWVRWGGTRHSVNGIPMGTTYSIVFGNDVNSGSIELKKETIYSNFIDRVWRAVGVRLLTEYLEGLRDGQKYHFGSTVISDHGMELERKRFFGTGERVFCPWSELAIWNGAGVFCVGKKGDKKLMVEFSYLEQNNIHVLETAIRMLWKQGGDRLSSLLRG